MVSYLIRITWSAFVPVKACEMARPENRHSAANIKAPLKQVKSKLCEIQNVMAERGDGIMHIWTIML